MIELAFDGLLRGSAAVTALAVGGIYPATLPKDLTTWPAIHYLFIGGSASASLTTTGTAKYRVEVNCWGTSYYDAVTLRSAVITTLNGYSDADMVIQLIQPRDLFDDDLLQFRAMVEFYVYFTL